MSTLFTENDCARFPIWDYDELEAELNAVRQKLSTLQPRHLEMTAELDRITRPKRQAGAQVLRTIQRGLEYRGVFAGHGSCIAIHLDVLRHLWTEFPERQEEMVRALRFNGRSRTYVARTREELFRGQTAAWVLRHSRVLVDGWYVDTNMNPQQMQKILREVVAVAGLKWGEDVKVFWRPTQVSVTDARMSPLGAADGSTVKTE
jgi:hypothetical protein